MADWWTSLFDDVTALRARLVATVHGSYYLLGGLWPLVGMDSFLVVTGPKTDLWLVRAMSLVLVGVGLSLAAAAARRVIPIESVILAITCALSLAVIDLTYVLSGTIRPIYLVDALIELAICAGWVLTLVRVVESYRGKRAHSPVEGATATTETRNPEIAAVH